MENRHSFRCCFAGHNKIYNKKVVKKIENVSIRLIEKYNVKEFWVGNYGGFDLCASQTIYELKQIYKDIKLNLIVPYMTNKISCNINCYNRIYDDIIIAQMPFYTPMKARIIKANQYMVNNSSYLISFIDHDYGGAYKTFQYANNCDHIKIINIADILDSVNVYF